jgi:cysteine synthase
MCRTLGYRAVVMIPKNMPAARIHQIESYGAEVKLSGEAYIDGLVADLRKQWATERHKPDTCFPNHAMVSSDWAWKPMEVLGEEILSQFAAAEGGTRPDCFVTALGNGISAMGVGTALKNAGALVYGMEPIESPTVYYKFFPDRYKRKFGSDQPRFSSHLIYGTGPGAKIIFPNIEAIAPKLEDVFHPTKNDVMSIRDRLMFEELQLVGNSSAACLWACLKLAEEKRNVTIVTIMYDAAWRYLPFERVK